MARRSRDWNEGLADDLQDPEFARQFLTAAVENGVPLKLALAKVIRATGVKEFSQSVGMPSPNVLRAKKQSDAGNARAPPEAIWSSDRLGSDQATAKGSRGVASVSPALPNDRWYSPA
jgi:hypothetical protein